MKTLEYKGSTYVAAAAPKISIVSVVNFVRKYGPIHQFDAGEKVNVVSMTSKTAVSTLKGTVDSVMKGLVTVKFDDESVHQYVLSRVVSGYAAGKLWMYFDADNFGMPVIMRREKEE